MNEATGILSRPYRLLLGCQAAMITDESVQAIRRLAPDAFERYEIIVEEAVRHAGSLAADAERCEHLPDELPRLRARLALVDARIDGLLTALDELRRVALAP